MPRSRWSFEGDAALLDAVFDPSLAGTFSARTQTELADVRAVYVQRLGWNRSRLARYRFRVLAATARRTPTTATVVLRPPGDLVGTLPEGLLEAQLAHMSELPLDDAAAHFSKMFDATPEVVDFVRTYRVTLTDTDRQRLAKLAQALGVPIRPGDETRGNPDLSRAIARLIEELHERVG